MKTIANKLLIPLTVLFISSILTACQPVAENSDSASASFSVQQLNTVSADFSAHWLTPRLLLLPKSDQQYSVALVKLSKNNILTQSPNLIPSEMPNWLAKNHPHLEDFQAYQVDLSEQQAKNWLKHKLMVAQFDAKKTVQGKVSIEKISYVQTANLIDHLYTGKNNDANEVDDFGAIVIKNKTGLNAANVQFKLWAPTAQQITVLLFNQDKTPAMPAKLPMIEDRERGVWSALTTKEHAAAFYQYQIELYHPASKKFETLVTTDPYSLSLSTNSEHSQVIDLNSSTTMPNDWQSQKDNIVGAPENNIFYETHIRDFSAHDPKLSDPSSRGKYQAFSELNSAGIKHLKKLKKAGINNIHLLPTFDIGTANELDEEVVDLNDNISKVCQLSPSNMLCHEKIDGEQTIRHYLKSLPKDDEQRQAVVSSIRERDNYNWGYDPFHYTVPEGSYANNPDGYARIIEFREMVQSIHNLGFRVIMDVVYNHTHQAALEPTAVLDKIVPNYYHRLDPITGKIAQSTCCDNTATEQVMMEKLMIDSLVVWARDYRIDGFRFDLMAHQPKSAMLKARTAVQAVDSDTYFYGEGWNFGEVANNQRFIQASQLELGGTEIGTFTDRMRDAVRGGAFSASSDDIRKSQGIGNGLGLLPNDLLNNNQEYADKYSLAMDQLRIGLAGNLVNFPIENSKGEKVTGKDIPYGDQPTGYALDPADTINYISKHDNQTLWDNNQYRLPYSMPTKDRVRLHLQSLAFPILSQGIPFIHMGSELLRSKSFLRDSYDYGDWFNKVDFTMQDNNYNVGLPPADKDQANWSLIKKIIDRNQGRDHVSSADIKFSAAVFMEFIKIRMSEPLFRLKTASEIIEQVKFHNTGKDQQKGLIVMSLTSSSKLKPLSADNETTELVVVFNTSDENKTISYAQAELFKLHPIQFNGADSIVKTTSIEQGKFSVPSFTTAVFVK